MAFPYFQTLMAECLKAQGVEDAEQVAAKAIAVLEVLKMPMGTVERDALVWHLSKSTPQVMIGKRLVLHPVTVHRIIERHQRLRRALIKKQPNDLAGGR